MRSRLLRGPLFAVAALALGWYIQHHDSYTRTCVVTSIPESPFDFTVKTSCGDEEIDSLEVGRDYEFEVGDDDEDVNPVIFSVKER